MNIGETLSLALAFGVTLSAFGAQPLPIERRLGMMEPYPLTDSRLESLKPREKRLISLLVSAADVLDDIFLEQMHPSNHGEWLPRLRKLAEEETEWRRYLDYFRVSYGPWDVFLDEWILPKEEFPEVPKLPGKNVYPVDLYPKGEKDAEKRAAAARAELEKWLKSHPEDEKAFKSHFTLIRRDAEGGFKAVPYSKEYKDRLRSVSESFKRAARLAEDPALKRFLRARGKAFRADRYIESEKSWIDSHDSDIQATFGPYEEYMDEIWGRKRGFGARVALKDAEATKDLQLYVSLLKDFQRNLGSLPVASMFLGDDRRGAYVTVVNEIYATGEARWGAQTLAHNLPNDLDLTERFGSRRVLFKNVIEGKCKILLVPIAEVVLSSDQAPHVSCDAFTKSVLHHELAHALGPAFWYPKPALEIARLDEAGRRNLRKDFSEVLGPYDQPVEEAKADVLGMYNRGYMFDRGLEKSARAKMEMYATYVAGFFRTVRFGAGSAHRKGVMLQFNKLRELGAVSFDERGRCRFDPEKMPSALRQVAALVLKLKSDGNPEAVEEALKTYGGVPPEMRALLDEVNASGIPRDLYPVFPIRKMAWLGAGG